MVGSMGRVSQETKKMVRNRLLEEAAKQFAKNGYDRTNVNDVALRAGFAKGTIYNYFKSKEELFGEVIAEAARRAVARYSAATVKGSTREALRSLAAADLSVLKEEESFMKVLVGEAMSPRSDNYDLVLKHLSPFIDAITEILSSGVELEEVRDDRPVVQLSLVFLGILTLLYIQHWRSGGAWPKLDEIPELATTVFLDGAGGRDAPGSRRSGRSGR